MFNIFQKWRWKWCRGMVTDFKSFGWRHYLHRPTDSIHFLLPTFILLLNPLSATLRTFFCWAEIECWAGETREARRPPLNGVCQPELKSWQAATERGRRRWHRDNWDEGCLCWTPLASTRWLAISVFLLPFLSSKMDCQNCLRQCLQCQCLQRCALALTRAPLRSDKQWRKSIIDRALRRGHKQTMTKHCKNCECCPLSLLIVR